MLTSNLTPFYRLKQLNRSIVIGLLLFSPLFLMFSGQPAVVALLVSSTTTQTATSYVTLSGTVETTQYQTFTQVSTIQTIAETTYTTTGVAMGQTQVFTVVVFPVTVVTQTGGTTCNAANQCVGWAGMATVTYYQTEAGWVQGYAPYTVEGTVTKKHVTSVPTTLFSTSASTSTYSTGQVLAVTATQTLTSVSEQAGPSIFDMLTQNLWVVLVVAAVVLGILGFRFGRRSDSQPKKRLMQKPAEDNVAQILRRRYAAGEISREEYQRMLSDLDVEP